MAYDEKLAERMRTILADRTDVVEKKMFGGLAFMLAGNMCCGINGKQLMARVGPEQYENALKQPHAREMDFTGRSLKGFVYVDEAGTRSAANLNHWITLCTDFASGLPPK